MIWMIIWKNRFKYWLRHTDRFFRFDVMLGSAAVVVNLVVGWVIIAQAIRAVAACP